MTAFLRKELHALIDRLEEKDLRVLWFFTKRYRQGDDHQ